MQEQIAEITSGIQELKEEKASVTPSNSLKNQKTLKLKLDKLNDTSRKDDVVTFEELGVDRLLLMRQIFIKICSSTPK